jgi:hypothetical protein
MVTNTSQQDEGFDRDRQNIADLQNGGHKFILDGKTLQLPGVTPSDSRSFVYDVTFYGQDVRVGIIIISVHA